MFKTTATKLVQNPTLLASLASAVNKDPKLIQEVIIAEKAISSTLRRLSAEFVEAAKALQAWGVSEGEEFGDILGAASAVLGHFSTALTAYASNSNSIRTCMRRIEEKEELVESLKRRHRSMIAKAETTEKKLARKPSRGNIKAKNIKALEDAKMVLKEDLSALKLEIRTGEADLAKLKRDEARKVLRHKFGGLEECAKAGGISAEHGSQLIAEIHDWQPPEPGEEAPAYQGHARIHYIVMESQQAINELRMPTSTTLAVPGKDRRRPHLLPVTPIGQDEDSSYESPAPSARSTTYLSYYEQDGAGYLPSPGSSQGHIRRKPSRPDITTTFSAPDLDTGGERKILTRKTSRRDLVPSSTTSERIPDLPWESRQAHENFPNTPISVDRPEVPPLNLRRKPSGRRAGGPSSDYFDKDREPDLSTLPAAPPSAFVSPSVSRSNSVGTSSLSRSNSSESRERTVPNLKLRRMPSGKRFNGPASSVSERMDPDAWPSGVPQDVVSSPREEWEDLKPYIEAQAESVYNAQLVLSNMSSIPPPELIKENLVVITTIATRVLDMSTGSLPPHALQGMDILWELTERNKDLQALQDADASSNWTRQHIIEASLGVWEAMKRLNEL